MHMGNARFIGGDQQPVAPAGEHPQTRHPDHSHYSVPVRDDTQILRPSGKHVESASSQEILVGVAITFPLCDRHFRTPGPRKPLQDNEFPTWLVRVHGVDGSRSGRRWSSTLVDQLEGAVERVPNRLRSRLTPINH
jgi:hypothetical protein